MPYYSWKGILLSGKTCMGKEFAQNERTLQTNLLKREIGLMRCKEKHFWFKGKINAEAKIDYFKQISVLIRSGILLPHALTLVAAQTAHSHFAHITHQIAYEVNTGNSFAAALEKYNFDLPIIQMIIAGQESGNLALMLDILIDHLELIQEYKNRLKSALIMPAFTGAFFLFIFSIILFLLLPQLQSMLIMIGKPMPSSLQKLLMLKKILVNHLITVLFAFFIIGFMAKRIYDRNQNIRVLFSSFLLKIPFINQIIISHTMSSFFRSLAMLIKSGFSLCPAFSFLLSSIPSIALYQVMNESYGELKKGNLLSQAFVPYPWIFPQEVVAMIHVGQESGSFAPLLVACCHYYQKELVRHLDWLTKLITPLLLIIMGLLVATLIISIYMPLLSLSFSF